MYALLCAVLLGTSVAAELRTVPVKPGRTVEIQPLLVADQENIVCFYSAGNSICRGLYPELVKMGTNNSKVVLHMIEVPNAQAPMARKYAVTSVPHFKIYDKMGQLVSEGAPAYKTVTDLMRQGR